MADLGGGHAPRRPPYKILLAVWSRYKSSICRIYLFLIFIINVDLLIDFLSSYNSSRACSRPKQQHTGS